MDKMSFCILVIYISYIRGPWGRWGRQSFPGKAYGNLGMRQGLSPTSSPSSTINTTMQTASRLFPDRANFKIQFYLNVKWSCSISSRSGHIFRGALSYLEETSVICCPYDLPEPKCSRRVPTLYCAFPTLLAFLHGILGYQDKVQIWVLAERI